MRQCLLCPQRSTSAAHLVVVLSNIGNGKSHRNGVWKGKSMHKWGIFQHEMFDDQRGIFSYFLTTSKNMSIWTQTYVCLNLFIFLHYWADHSHVHLAGPTIQHLLAPYFDSYSKSCEVPGFDRSTKINPFSLFHPHVEMEFVHPIFGFWAPLVDIPTVFKFQLLLVQHGATSMFRGSNHNSCCSSHFCCLKSPLFFILVA